MIKIISDSTCDLSKELLEKYGEKSPKNKEYIVE